LVAASPLLLGGQSKMTRGSGDTETRGQGETGTAVSGSLLSSAAEAEIAASSGSLRLEDVLAAFSGEVAHLATVTSPGETVARALDRLEAVAVEAVRAGARVVLLDDGEAFSAGQGWIDPHLAVAAVDRALSLAFQSRRAAPGEATGRGSAGSPLTPGRQESLRRQVGILLRSGHRNLNDLSPPGLAPMRSPYLLFGRRWRLPEEQAGASPAIRACAQDSKGDEPDGIHELRGYGRIFAGIGLSGDGRPPGHLQLRRIGAEA
jgi:glutamate synthase (NADPH/NADH) large chain